MTELPQDQGLLRDDLIAKLDTISDLPAMLRFMAEVLQTLLKRRGDAAFLAAVQDAFAAALVGITWPEHRTIAAQVIRLVIEKRPEIAKAWRAAEEARLALEAQGKLAMPETPARREVDLMPPPPPLPMMAASEQGPYDFAAAETRIGEHLAELIDRRLELLRVALPSIPSFAYCHTQPFFLFDPRLGAVLKAFVTGPLLMRCRVGLERRVYVKVDNGVLGDPAKARTFWAEMRPHVWKAVDSRLDKLAQHHKSAEHKLDAQSRGVGFDPEVKVVEKEVVRPRTYNIMGVEFSLGKEHTTKKVKVKLPPANQLNKDEEDALSLIDELRHGATLAGVFLPETADFQFLRTLFDFNTRLFAQTRDELLGLAGHSQTTPRFLRERIREAEKHFNTHLLDILVMMMFTKCADVKFGFGEFYATCVGSAREKTAIAAKRPFIPAELERRPMELAVQLREALKARMGIDAVLGAAERYLECHRVMGKHLYGAELTESRALIEAFPMTFGTVKDSGIFIQVGQSILDMLDGKIMEAQNCLMQIARAYDPIGRKTAPA